MFWGVNPKLAVLMERQGGVFSRRDAIACGYSAAEIRVRIRSGVWRRVCRGQYTTGSVDPQSPPWLADVATHRLASAAALRSMTGDVVLSHQSATVDYGLPAWGLDLSRVHVTRRDNSGGRITRTVVQHNAHLPAGSIWLRAGRHVVTPARSVIEVAGTAGVEPALAIADEALRRGLITMRALEYALCDAANWPTAPRARQVVQLANGLSESVGESRLRLLMNSYGLPEPMLQVEIFDDGVLIARVDFLFGDFRTIVEFDGMVKYGDNPNALIWEKRREDRLRDIGYEVVRVTWSDFDAPHRAMNRIEQAFARSRGRGYPLQTWVPTRSNQG
jgi:hypothetical protein